jgi:hypothetical protein
MGDFAPCLDVPTSTGGAAPVQAPQRGRATLWIALAGALAYNSWPLAFLVNRSLAGSALASSFEGRSEPFSWLFILLDCIAGLCTGIVCIRELRPRGRYRRAGSLIVCALLAYGVFGMATAVDAVVPLDCGSTSAQACASQLWPLTPDDVLTGSAVLALFVAAVAALVHTAGRPAATASFAPATIVLTLIGWSALGLVVLMWSSAAVMAAVCQYAFITLTGLLSFLVVLGATETRLPRADPRAAVRAAWWSATRAWHVGFPPRRAEAPAAGAGRRDGYTTRRSGG